MSFANPVGLLGLLALPLILALHLLRERQKRYVVSNLDLWGFLEAEVRGSRPRRIPLTLLLILDLLVGLLLALAWARPNLDLPVASRSARQLILLLDVSTSMMTRDALPDRFSQARLAATSLLNGLGPRDVATVLTFGQKARWVADTRQGELSAILEQISDLQPGETGQALSEALALGTAFIDPKLPVEFHILTDGAYPELPLEGFPYPVEWHFWGQATDNQAVLDVRVTPLEQARSQVFARLANFGAAPASRIVSLLSDGAPVESTPFQIPPESTLSQVWEISGAPTEVVVSLLGGDDLREDDRAYIGRLDGQPIQVQLVSAAPSSPDSAADDSSGQEARFLLEQSALNVLKKLPGVQLSGPLSPQEYNPVTPYDLTIFFGFLPERLPGGRSLALGLPEALSSNGIVLREGIDIAPGAVLQQSSSDPFVNGLDFRGVRWVKAWALSELPDSFAPLLQADGNPLIVRGDIGGSQSAAPAELILVLADLSVGNFTKLPVFPIFLATLVEESRRAQLPEQVFSGEAIPLPPASEYLSIQVAPPEAEPTLLRGNWPAGWAQTLTPGVYRFELERLDGKLRQDAVAVNAGSPTEADVRPQPWTGDAPTLRIAGSGEAGGGPVEAAQKVELMPWLLGLAILILFVEAAFAWR